MGWTRREFENEATEQRPGDVQEWALRLALGAHRDLGGHQVYMPQHLSDVYNLARQIVAGAPTAQSPPVALLSASAMARLEAAKLLEPVALAARHVRQAIFGQDDPPFPGDDEAASAWVWEREEAAHRETAATESARAEEPDPWEALHEAQRELAASGNLIGWDHVATWYPRPGERAASALYADRGPLLLIRQAAADIERSTGFSNTAVSRYILTGTEPTLSRASVRLKPITAHVTVMGEGFGMVRRQEVHIALRVADVTDSELRDLVRSALSMVGGRERPRVTDDDLRLHRIAAELGHDPDTRGAWSLTGFWAQVANRWTDETGETLTPRTLSDRYRRWLKRVKQAPGARVATIDPTSGEVKQACGVGIFKREESNVEA